MTQEAHPDALPAHCRGPAKEDEAAFQEQGRPNGFIKGEEGSAAVTVGVRYDNGAPTVKSGGSCKVYWSGPSIGLGRIASARRGRVPITSRPGWRSCRQRRNP